MPLLSFNSSPALAFVASPAFARNAEEDNVIDQLVGVSILFSTPGPLSSGQFDLNRNRFFMQDMLNHLSAFPYPQPQTPQATNATIDYYTVSAQSDASGNMINIIYTKISTGNQNPYIAWTKTPEPSSAFVFAQCEFKLRTALNSNPPRYNTIWCSKVKFDLGAKRFPVCISKTVLGVSSCERSHLMEPEVVAGEWSHSGTEIELFPALPDLASISSDWYGKRRVDVLHYDGTGGPRDGEGNIVPATPDCCSI